MRERRGLSGMGALLLAGSLLLLLQTGSLGEDPPGAGGQIEGVVVGVEGQPLAGIEVTAVRVQRRPDAMEERRRPLALRFEPPRPVFVTVDENVHRARTNDRGSFALRALDAAAQYRLGVADTENHLAVSRHALAYVGASPIRIRLVLVPGHVRRLQVLGAGAGAPSWVTVHASPTVVSHCAQDGSHGRVVVDKRPTDEQGRLTFSAPLGHRLHVRVEAPGVGDWLGEWTAEGGDEVFEIRLRDRPGATVDGRIVDSAERPVPGARVRAMVDQWSGQGPHTYVGGLALTDAEGRYEIRDLPVGRLDDLHVEAEGFLSKRWRMLATSLRPEVTETLSLSLVRGGVVAGRVVDADGAPIAGASVYAPLIESQEHHATYFADHRPAATTDAEGRFVVGEVPVGRVEIVAAAAGYYAKLAPVVGHRRREVTCGAWLDVPSEGARVETDLVLHRGVAITGVVRDAEGEGVPGLGVSLNRAEMRQGRDFAHVEPTETGADGSFVLDGAEPFTPFLVSVHMPGCQPAGARLAWTPDGVPEPVEIVLRPPTAVKGRVVDAAEKTVPFARLRWERLGPRVPEGPRVGTGYADASGAFRLEHLPSGRLRIYLEHEPDGPGAKEVEVEAGALVDGIVLRTTRAGILRGRVVDEAGHGLAGVSVRLVEERQSLYVVTGGDGRFAMKHLATPTSPKGYRVRLDSKEPERFVAPGAEETVLVLRPPTPPRWVEGRVVLPNGDPVPLADALIWWERGGSTQRVLVRAGRFRSTTWADDRPFDVTIHAPRDIRGRPLDLRVGVAEAVRASDTPLRIQLEAGQAITGRVVDTEGEPVEGTRIHVYPQERPWWYRGRYTQALTDADGHFRIVGLGSGMHEVNVTPLEAFIPHPNLQVEAGVEGLRVTLERAASISGTVIDARGRPLGGITVRADRKGRNYASVRTDAQGRFVLLGFRPGARTTVQVLAAADLEPPHLGTSIEDVEAGTSDLRMVLEPAVAITGVVVGPDGERVEVSSIGVEPWYLEDARLPRGHLQLDPDSPAFRIALLAPVRYRLTFRLGPDWQDPEPVVVDAPAEDVRIEVPRAYPIRGTVAGELSRRTLVAFVPAGERIVIEQRGRLHARLRPHAVAPAKDGSFVIPNTEDQIGTILAWEWDSTAAVGLVESVRPGDGPFRIQLAEAVPLRGNVRDLPTSMRRARLTFYLVRPPLAFRVQIGRDGTFHVPWLVPGEYALEARNVRLRGRIEGPAVIRVDRDAGPLTLRYVSD